MKAHDPRPGQAGEEVQKSSSPENGKLCWYGLSGEVLTESDLAGNIIAEYIFFN
ncbi:MAG: hypothetical protein O7A06_08325 [Acidobacteria bacterium]|nr:hypothetical protein [Acidobacteriota bacterium]